MSFHIVDVGSPRARLSCRNGSLECSLASGVKTLPLQDVCSIIVTSFDATITSSLLIEAAKTGTSMVLCHNFKPVSVLLPANRSTDTLLTRAQSSLSKQKKSQLWGATIDAKCANQLQAVLNLGGTTEQVEALRRCAFSKKPFKEANCARLYWSMFAQILEVEDFRRQPRVSGMNALLNYGYAVLLSVVLQRLMAVGIDPTWGIAHKPRERAVALCYDLMEPFRPLIDERVGLWIRQHHARGVTPEFKSWITAVCKQKVIYRDAEISLVAAVESVARSFRRAVATGRPGLYRPWTSTNSKWAG